MKSLTKKQLLVINDLFDEGGDETAIRQKHNISQALWQKWQSDKHFNDEIAGRLNSSKRQSQIILAKYIPLAAAKLVELCGSDKEETRRKACLDILALQSGSIAKTNDTDESADDEEKTPLDAETAAKILAALAENPQSCGGQFDPPAIA